MQPALSSFASCSHHRALPAQAHRLRSRGVQGAQPIDAKPLAWRRFVGNPVVLDEVQNRLPRPVEQRIELEQAAFGVAFDDSHSRTMKGLVTAQAGDPGIGAGKAG